MTDENNTPEDEEPGTTKGLLGAIRLVVNTLAEAEREGRITFDKSGRMPGDHFRTEYGFSGQIGGPRRRSDSPSDTRSPADSTKGNEDRHLVDVREVDDGLLVVADMPDVERRDITVGINEERNELVVGVGSEAIERLELPWPVTDVDAQFQHGILELQFTREVDK